MPSKASRRCHFFDSQGNPYRGGCPRNTRTCHFVHPDEPDWRALPSVIPRSSSTTDPGRRPSDSPPRRRDSMASSSFESQFKSRHRDDGNSEHSRVRIGRDDRRKSDEPGQQRYHSTSSMTPTISPSLPNHPLALYSQTTTLPHHLLEAQNMPKVSSPLQPSSLPPPQPVTTPPPLPTPPAFLSSERLFRVGPISSKDELSVEEKRTKWTERIKLVSECVNTRTQHMKLEDELRDLRRMANSWRYASLPNDNRMHLDAKIADMESRCEDKKKALHVAIGRLVDSDSWPVGQRSLAQDGVEEKYREMVKYVEELKNAATEIHSVLSDVREAKVAQRKAANLPVDSDTQESQPGSLKRRRVSEDLEGRREPEEYRPTSEEIEEIRDNLLAIEERLSNFENDLIAHDEELKDELTGRLETKLEDFQQGKSLPETTENSSVEQSTKFLEVEQNINTTGEQVGELAEEVGNLILRSSAVDTDVERLARENEQFKQELVLMQHRLQGYADARDRDTKEIEALNAVLSAYMARPLSPPASPRNVAPEYILQALEEPLLESLRSNIEPLVSELRANIQDMLRTQKVDMYETLWAKLSLTLRMVEAISARVSQGGG